MMLRWIRRLTSHLTSPFRRGTFDAELADEMQHHLELRRQALIDRGMEPAAADREARRLFGNTTALRERTRDEREFPSFSSFLQDLRFGTRLALRNPGHSAAIVVTIALGAGLNGALFLVVNAAYLRPPDLPEAANVIRIDDGKPGAGLSYPDYVDYRDRAAESVDLAAFSSLRVAVRVGPGGSEAPERASVAIASGNYFDVLGVRPLLGRTFTGGDDLPPRGTPVVMLGEAYWSQRFNRDPDVIGRSIEINLQPFTVIGIVPASFRDLDPPGGPLFAREMWAPLWTLPALAPGDNRLLERDSWWGLQAIGRLRGGSMEHARAQAAVVAAALDREHPGGRPARTPWLAKVTEIDRRVLRGEIGVVLAAFSTATLLVLLIAAANVAGLLLARASARSREIAVRLSLGAGRLRIVRQFLTESLILSSAGIVLGFLTAYWALQAISASASAQPLAVSLAPDARVVVYGLGLALMVAIATGIAPALQASKTTLVAALKDVAPGRTWLRSMFISAEVAACLIFLVLTGLLMRAAHQAQTIDPVIAADNLLTMAADDGALHGYVGPRHATLLVDMQRHVETLPGVSGVALANPVPFSGNRHGTMLRRAEVTDAPGVRTFLSSVSPSFFTVARLPIVRGRTFASSTDEVVVSETLAARLWGTESPLGQLVISGDFDRRSHTVVGVARDAPFLSLRERNEPFLFRAIGAAEGGQLVVRTAGPAAAITREAGRALKRVDSRVTFTIRPIADGIADEISAARARSWIVAAVGGLALLLSLIGIGAVASQVVVQRTREIGVRMALGANAANAVSVVVRGAILPVIGGCGLGILGASLLSRVLVSQLYGLPPFDPLAFAGAVVVLIVTAVVAAGIPARRAAQIDPLIALRSE